MIEVSYHMRLHVCWKEFGVTLLIHKIDDTVANICAAALYFPPLSQSVTFDPFMYLSVPIPIRNEKLVAITLLPRIRTKDIGETASGDDPSSEVTGEGEFTFLTFVVRYSWDISGGKLFR